jgi:hypothetical protein
MHPDFKRDRPYDAAVLRSVADEDVSVILDCLGAAVEGPFFPDWEFRTLMGVSRAEVAEVLHRWPDGPDAQTQDLAVNNVLNMLLGYPHGRDDLWPDFIAADRDEVRSVLERWRGESG